MKNNQPTAHVAVNKNVVKVQQGSANSNGVSEIVYLNNDQEFQIELFNPTNGVIAAEIFLNDQKAFSSMLVLRPAERLFLDCNPETKRKFKFETYSVSGSNQQVKEAIKDNGKVEVKFYRETIPAPVVRTYPYYGGLTWVNAPGTFYFGTSNPIVGATFTTSCNNASMDTLSSDSEQYSCEVNMQTNSLKRSKSLKKEIETGRIEAGAHSNQGFNTVDKQFDYFTFHTVSVQIIPTSQKPLTSQSIRNYCTGCGARLRQTAWKFCPSCGNKF